MNFVNGKTYWCIHSPGSGFPVVKPWQGVLHYTHEPWCTVRRLVPLNEMTNNFYLKSKYAISREYIFHTEAEAQRSYIKYEKVRLECVRDKAIRDLERFENEGC